MATGKTYTEFDEYKVTNASISWKKGQTYEAGEKFGCTGKLEVETEMRTVTKKCEGDEVKHYDFPTKITGTWTGHVPVETLRNIWGLDPTGLKKGVFAYGTDSRQGQGRFSFETLSLEGDISMLRAFPNLQFTGGLKWSLENGGEEIAEIEQEFTAMKDENNKLFYEAMDSTAEPLDAEIKGKWFTEFTPELVKDSTAVKGK